GSPAAQAERAQTSFVRQRGTTTLSGPKYITKAAYHSPDGAPRARPLSGHYRSTVTERPLLSHCQRILGRTWDARGYVPLWLASSKSCGKMHGVSTWPGDDPVATAQVADC